MFKFQSARSLVGGLATASVLACGASSDASVLTNGSFEADALGSTSITGWANDLDGVNAEIITSTIGDGLAVELSANLTNEARFGALQQNLGAFNVDAPGLIVGEQYVLNAVIEVDSGTAQIGFFQENQENGTLNFSEGAFGGFYSDEITAGAVTPISIEFTYFGGFFGVQTVIGNLTPTTIDVVSRFDSIEIVAVPEPASLVLTMAGALAMLGRRGRLNTKSI